MFRQSQRRTDETDDPSTSLDGRSGDEPGGAGAASDSASIFEGPPIEIPSWLTRDRLALGLVAFPILVIVVLAVAHTWTSDDGFAYFRVVDQIRAGNGPVFNQGERVEAVASPAWLGVLVVADFISPFRLELIAAVLSIAATATGVALATLGSRHLWPSSESHFFVPAGSAVLAVLWPVWIWASGGVEIGLAFAWLGACQFVLAKWSRGPVRPIGRRALALLGAGWLVRPELGVASVVFVVMAVTTSRRSTRQRWMDCAAAFAVPVAYQVIRMGYYGVIVPTSWIARDATSARPGLGWSYVLDFVGPYLLAIPLLALAFGVLGPFVRERLANGEDRRAAVACITMLVAGISSGALVVAIGGDYIHARQLLPPLFAALAPVMMVPAVRLHAEALVAVAGWSVLSLLTFRPPAIDLDTSISSGYVDGRLTYEDLGFERRGVDQRWIEGPGIYVAATVGNDAFRTDITIADGETIAVLADAAGPVGYALGPDAYVLDLRGSADPLIAHQDRSVELRPGIERGGFGPWLLARLGAAPTDVRPDQLPVQPPGNTQTEPLLYLSQVPWAQAALECPAIRDLRESFDEPMSLGRFVENIAGALTNTGLQYSVLPQWATERHCGPATPPVVDTYNRSVRIVDDLPDDAESAQVAIIDQCASVYVGSGDPDDPWTPVEAPTMTASLDFDETAVEAHRVELFTVAPIGGEGATIWLETDDDARFRLVLEEGDDAFALEWTPIGRDRVEIAVAGDTFRRVWTLTVNGVPVGDVQMVERDDTGVTSARVPTPASQDGALPDGIDVGFRARVASVSCLALVDSA